MGRGIGLRELFVSHVSWYVVQKKKNPPRRAARRRELLTTAQLWERRAWSDGNVGERTNKFRLWVIPLGANEEKKKVQEGTAKLQCTIFSATDIATFSNVELLEHKAFQPVWDAHQCLLWQANAAILRGFCETAAEQWAKRCLSHISGSLVLAGPKHDCSTLEWHCVPKNSAKYTLCDGFHKSVHESQVSVQLKFKEWPDAISCAPKIDESVVGEEGLLCDYV